MSNFLRKLLRRKHVDLENVEDTKLHRCLSTLDLTFLGIGSTLGAGIYVVAGQVAKETAGPSVVLSFFIAAVASVLAGMCYAEFGARVPKTGSAYVYSYVTVGELWAFIIGWNLILEYVIGTASVARAWSAYFDTLIGGAIEKFFSQYVHIDVPYLSKYPDFFALAITLLLTVILAIGVKESSFVNNIFTGVNLLVVTYVVVCGCFKADFKNWNISENQVPNYTDPTEPFGHGGFFSYGISGTLSGAATCFYAFVGFDCIATTGEEVQNPQKAIPISIIVSLLACFAAYFGISAILTLMWPYYDLDSSAPLPVVFDDVGWTVAKYIIAVGAICGLSTSLLGAMFPMPRVIYAMAQDGLLFWFLADISPRFHTPLLATAISGILSGCMAMLFDLTELVNMMSIGTLLAYTLVGACVLILRYRPDKEDILSNSVDLGGQERYYTGVPLLKDIIRTAFVRTGPNPTDLTSTIVAFAVLIIGFLVAGISAVIIYAQQYLANAQWWAILLLLILVVPLILLVIVIWIQPQNKRCVTFLVPGVPVMPVISMFVNIFLMLKLPVQTWVRFGVWMLLGFLIYFGYGIWKSQAEPDYRLLEQEPDETTGILSDEESINPAEKSSYQ
ncbi:cationic amino acid transporter 2-like [Lingula anatina]|uniref:Cationic amino acid transporter 2-like n=1 Tax=Lingula anatina TaxID=7574 RepID=A0A1S3JQF6_LINAN|nr:cationic amino acid transporter 2-like [Lingula anatina]|eukprot:XP_013412585.1 cationic amino acid transporter 2-like [Lingula anatina]